MYNPTQRLMRSRTDKVIAGVAGGIGQYLAIDPVIVRLAFVALCFTGVGILLYPVLWLIKDLAATDEKLQAGDLISLGSFARGNYTTGKPRKNCRDCHISLPSLWFPCV